MKFFKPNPKVTGHAVGFQFNSKDSALYAQFVRQSGWNQETKKGSFKEGEKFNTKLNETEIGAILNCIERRLPTKLFHQTEKGSTSIEIKTYAKDNVNNGFTLTVQPKGDDKKSFGFWFNEAEARVLKEYLQFVLFHFFSAEYSAEKQRRNESFKKEKPSEAAPKAGDSDPFE